MRLTEVNDRTFWRFFNKVMFGVPGPLDTDCWEWQAGKCRGYGRFRLSGKTKQAHCVAYEWLRDLIPKKLQLDHLCRNHACVNPDHLEPVTLAENIKRGLTGQITGAMHRSKTHCLRGHEYNDANTYVYMDGSRQCRVCCRDDQRERRRNKKREMAV